MVSLAYFTDTFLRRYPNARPMTMPTTLPTIIVVPSRPWNAWTATVTMLPIVIPRMQ